MVTALPLTLSLFIGILVGGIKVMSASLKPSPVLNIGIPNIKYNLDPHKMDDGFSMMMNLQIHRGLLRYTPEGNVVADLAASWDVDPQNLHFVFQLKKSVFSDGTPILAEHVRQSLARMFYVGSSMGADLEYIKGSKEFRKTKDINTLGIFAVGTDKIEIQLERPSALLTKHLATADCGILKINSFADAYSVDQITSLSGPYKIESMDKIMSELLSGVAMTLIVRGRLSK